MSIVYADNNATTAIAPEVTEAMMPFLTEGYFNPSSMYRPAQRIAQAVKSSRETIAQHFSAEDPREILFTSCATESNNMAIFGATRANVNRRHIITTSVEHPAVLEVCKQLERDGYDVTFLSVDNNGNLDLTEFIRALRPDTLMVSIMHANNETGVVFPIEQLSRITKETDPLILFHTDATQSVGKMDIDLSGDFKNVDLLSFSGHKLHAPKGVGALFLRRGTPCRPLLIGGHQEEGRRGGTENVPYIVGMAKAIELAEADHAANPDRVRTMRDRLETELVARIPYVQVNGSGAARLDNTLNISCHYIEGEGMLYAMDEYDICASSGSACTSGSLEPSHVLRALKVPFTAIHGSIRFSFSRYSTDADIDRIIEIFPMVVTNLRNLSPYWDKEKNAPRENLNLG